MTPFLLGWTVMFFAAAAPGPSTLAIMATSLAHGRGAGLRFAVGVVCGSCVWGLVAGLGVAALLTSAGWALTLFKVVGAAYLLWMAWKSWRAASAAAAGSADAAAAGPADAAAADDRPSDGAFWRRGLALHLSNPKAVMGWSATAAVGLPAGSGVLETAIFLGGCAVLALIINLGYALAFSTAPLIRAYGRARAALQRAFAAAFAAAGLGLLAWRP